MTSETFWCKKAGQWRDVNACLNRQEKKNPAYCGHCKQGREVRKKEEKKRVKGNIILRPKNERGKG